MSRSLLRRFTVDSSSGRFTARSVGSCWGDRQPFQAQMFNYSNKTRLNTMSGAELRCQLSIVIIIHNSAAICP